LNKIDADPHAAWGALPEAWLSDELPDHYAQLSLVVCDHAPLLARPRLARAVFETVRASADDAPGRLWGALVMPELARVIVGPGDVNVLDAYITAVTARSAARVLALVRRSDDDSLDVVLRYSPVWGGAIYRVWQAGYHYQALWSEGQLSNALYALAQRPVEAELAEAPDAWPWLWLGGA